MIHKKGGNSLKKYREKMEQGKMVLMIGKGGKRARENERGECAREEKRNSSMVNFSRRCSMNIGVSTARIDKRKRRKYVSLVRSLVPSIIN